MLAIHSAKVVVSPVWSDRSINAATAEHNDRREHLNHPEHHAFHSGVSCGPCPVLAVEPT